MNHEWKQFLESAGAHVDDGVARFDGAPCDESGLLCDLSHLGLIRIGGEDAAGFLQGQFTNDVTRVDGEHAQLSSYCTPKGRMLANFRLFRLGADYLLQLPRATHAGVLKRLPMFVLMSKVVIRDASDELASIGLIGKAARTALEAEFPRLPESPDEALNEKAMSLIRMPGHGSRFLLSGPVPALTGVWKRTVAAGARPGNAACWALHEIRAGIPWIDEETIEAFVPQMVNLQLINGVSFKKGCYTGQEVVARMKYLGKLKRRMYLARVKSDTPPRAGDALFSSTSSSGQGAGRVVNVERSPQGDYELLAVAEIAAREGDGLHLWESDGPRLEFMPLPYPFEEA
ncbi:MAG: folate-binding protein YgfZ [Candidatus Sedimenticola endophacoides]